MKKYVIIVLVLSCFIYSSCDRMICKDIDNWINEAPKALNEYLEVEREILNDSAFFNEFAYNKTNLFLRASDTSKYFIYEVPELKKWFRNNRGYISIDSNHTSFCFKECSDLEQMTASGYIYNNNNKAGTYKPQVIMLDSLYLKNGWFSHVITCKGCDD